MAVSMNSVTLKGTSIGSPPPPGYRYFRVNVTSWAGNNVRFQAVVIDVGLTLYPYSIGNMTSNTAPSPLVASASSQFAALDPYYAFSGGTGDSSRWASATSPASPQWIQIDLGSGNSIMPTQLRLRPDGAYASEYVTGFTFLASNTGAFAGEEVTLYTSGTLNAGTWGGGTVYVVFPL